MPAPESLVVRPGPTPRTLLSPAGETLSVPSGWALLPPGDAGLTRRVKAAGPTWTVQEKVGRRMFSRGVWAPAEHIERARAELDAERADPAYAKKLEAGRARREKKQVAYEAKRTRTRKVVIRAYCVDDRDTPHPASQVFAGEEVADGYDGELYRCIAGTRMQWTIVEWELRASNQGGKSFFCGKNESLYYEQDLSGGPNGGASVEGGSRAGRVACRPQRPARDCNERSLLRRFGAGVKVITIVEVETYTAYREETVREESSSSFNMSLDGGVGGSVY